MFLQGLKAKVEKDLSILTRYLCFSTNRILSVGFNWVGLPKICFGKLFRVTMGNYAVLACLSIWIDWENTVLVQFHVHILLTGTLLFSQMPNTLFMLALSCKNWSVEATYKLKVTFCRDKQICNVKRTCMQEEPQGSIVCNKAVWLQYCFSRS